MMNNEKLNKLIEIFNQVDPENLSPGQEDSPPITEYEIECKKVLNFIISKKNTLNHNNLDVEINNIWEEYFSKKCEKVELLSKNILLEVKNWD